MPYGESFECAFTTDRVGPVRLTGGYNPVTNLILFLVVDYMYMYLIISCL